MKSKQSTPDEIRERSWIRSEIASLEEEWGDLESEIEEAQSRQWEIQHELDDLREELDGILAERTPEQIADDEREAADKRLEERQAALLRKRYKTSRPATVADWWTIAPTGDDQ